MTTPQTAAPKGSTGIFEGLRREVEEAHGLARGEAQRKEAEAAELYDDKYAEARSLAAEKLTAIRDILARAQARGAGPWVMVRELTLAQDWNSDYKGPKNLSPASQALVDALEADGLNCEVKTGEERDIDEVLRDHTRLYVVIPGREAEVPQKQINW